MSEKAAAKNLGVLVSPSRAAKISIRAAVISLMASMISMAAFSAMLVDRSIREETDDLFLIFGNVLALATILVFATTIAQLRERASYSVNLCMKLVSVVVLLLLMLCMVVIHSGPANGVNQLVDQTYLLGTAAILLLFIVVYWWAMRIAGVAGTPGKLERYSFTLLFLLPAAGFLIFVVAGVLMESAGFFRILGGVFGAAICLSVLSFHRLATEVADGRQGVAT
ncbi:MAG: hypothetical protein PGN20_10440 [Agrobacterium cavarae]